MNHHDPVKEAPVPSIAPIRPDQIEAALELFRVQLIEHGIEAGADDLRRIIGQVIAEPRHGFILVAEEGDGKLAGVAFCSAFLGLEHGGESGWLEELYVLPAWRQKGVGTRLIQEVIRVAKERGWRALDLEVEADHLRVVSLYSRLNFQPHTRSRFCLKLD